MNRGLFILSTTLVIVSHTPLLAQNLTPEQAVERMKPADGFRVRLVASEPEVRQPLSMTFDHRGRLWVLQYLQYPNPAGLKAVSRDQYLRTIWDRVPEPPPIGPKGNDRITILSKPDRTGRYHHAQDFVGGLNLASGFTIGRGGVWVVQPPYLLFYPDRNGDDRPDGDPEVRLSGFGMEDSHAYANSLQWGPDGWLYGAHGSTVSASIRNPADPEAPPIEFEQGVWRYHPETREFELFSEGGGNTWGLDFDRHGQIIAGTNFGGTAMLHQVQGAYHVKNFGKHGPLHNPHTYGYFGHVPYTGFKGGHVTCGGVLYLAEEYPEEYHNQYIAGNLLANDLYWHRLESAGSSFRSRFGGDFGISGDPWFRPVDCLLGPDGCIHVADWHDERAAHLDPVDNWDRTNGRIMKFEYAETAKPFPIFDLSQKSSLELLELLRHSNRWYRESARTLLAERKDATVHEPLAEQIRQEEGLLALESLWALYVGNGLTDVRATEYLGHTNEHVRAWTIRLLGDRRQVNDAHFARLLKIAEHDPSEIVRSQLACTAKRLPGDACLKLVRRLLTRDEDVDDPYIPMLLWWALEDKALTDTSRALEWFQDAEFWKRPVVESVIVERIGRRYLAEESSLGYATCAQLLEMAPDTASVRRLTQGMEKALVGKRLTNVPSELERPLAKLWDGKAADVDLLSFAVRLGSPSAYQAALATVTAADTSEGDRRRLIELVGQAGDKRAVPAFLDLLTETKSTGVQSALLTALQGYDDPRITEVVLSIYSKLRSSERTRARSMLAARPDSTRALLQAVDAETISKDDFALSEAQGMVRHDDDTIQNLLVKHWGQLRPETDGEKLARIRWLNVALGRGSGNVERGQALFKKNCANCHKLFGEGEAIGPDLTSSDRKNRMYLLTHIVDPSAYVRPEYAAFEVETLDGRLLTGLLRDQTPNAITLVDAKNQTTVISRADIDEMRASSNSLMPEKVLGEFNDQMVRDLFAYMQKDFKK